MTGEQQDGNKQTVYPLSHLRQVFNGIDGFDGARMVLWIKEDQKSRWQKRQPIEAERYLELHPLLTERQALAVDVIMSEYRLRQRSGENPEPTEYLVRFPEYSDALIRKFTQERTRS